MSESGADYMKRQARKNREAAAFARYTCAKCGAECNAVALEPGRKLRKAVRRGGALWCSVCAAKDARRRAKFLGPGESCCGRFGYGALGDTVISMRTGVEPRMTK